MNFYHKNFGIHRAAPRCWLQENLNENIPLQDVNVPHLYGRAVKNYSCFKMRRVLLDVLSEEVTGMKTEPYVCVRHVTTFRLICIPQQMKRTKVKKLFLRQFIPNPLWRFLHTPPPFLRIIQTLGGFDFD